MSTELKRIESLAILRKKSETLSHLIFKLSFNYHALFIPILDALTRINTCKEKELSQALVEFSRAFSQLEHFSAHKHSGGQVIKKNFTTKSLLVLAIKQCVEEFYQATREYLAQKR